ncbi:MAG TPA: hypothetical protein VFC36_04620, partial [Paludibacter sp.]|nr:hypothetical protein [Paludibacter sp.]
GVMSMTGSSNSHCWTSSTYNNEFSSSFGWSAGSDSGVPSIYATYTPTSTTTTTTTTTIQTIQSSNLAPIPNSWSYATNGMWFSAGGVSNNVLDYNVRYNGEPTMRQDPVWSTNNYAREVNGPYLNVKPGDHIVFSCWIKTTASSYGDKDLNSGARIGIDFYGTKGALGGSVSPNGAVWTTTGGYPSNTYLNYVHWGTNTWTKIEMSFTVAQSYPAIYGYAGNYNYATGQWVTPSAIIPFMQVYSSTYGTSDSGQAWFADPQLTIN